VTSAADRLTAPALDGLSGVRHGFFTRRGGVSEGLYDSLNCGFSTGDAREKVQENRNRAVAGLGLAPDRLAAVRQVHSARVVVIGEDWAPGPLEQADALATSRRGVALGVLGADCAPVLLADPEAGVIGAAHAGWRGALDGVTDSVIDAMIGLGAEPSRIVAVIGPCIAQASYQVGPEFPAPFLAQDPANARFFEGGHFDLPGYLLARLERRGLGAVTPSLADTLARPDLFFSHRRATHESGGVAGRQISAIALEA
jgi:YfiH family protein